MSRQDVQPNSSVPKVQNVPTIPFSKLPEEVLSEIFMDVVFDYKNMGTHWPPSMESDVRTIHHSLYRLLSVCSSWRGIVLARDTLWSVIPIITTPSRLIDGQQPFQLSAQRSSGSELLLAANVLSSTYSAFSRILAEHGHCFHSINLRGRGFRLLDIQLMPCYNVTLPGLSQNYHFRLPTSLAAAMAHPITLNTLSRRDPLPASSTHGLITVTFPKLQSLLLQNLYFNTLGFLLPMIVPSTYRVSFTPTYASLMIHKKNDLNDDEFDGDIETNGFDTLYELLEHIIVDTLTIVDHCWLQGPRLRGLLESLSALKSLKFDSWSLDNDIRENLTRFHDAEIDSFPTLRNLYLTSVKMFDWEGFKEMVASHPFQKVVLGGTTNEDGSSGFRPLEDSDDPVVWLKATVPTVYLMSITYHVWEGYPNLWQLW